jgi:signal transduction histidine kinase
VLFAGFLCALPFLNRLPGEQPAFIPIIDTTLFLTDLITASVLYAQFAITRSRGLLALATGYLFTSFIIVPHLLTFPNVLGPNGVFGSGLQSTAWLNTFWHFGLPLASIAYIQLKGRAGPDPTSQRSVSPTIISIVVAVACLVTALAWLVIEAGEYFPDVRFDTPHGDALWRWGIGPLLLILNITAMVLIRKKQSSVLDLSLLVALWAWFLETFLLAATKQPYSVAWYAGRIFGLSATSLVLLVVLSELTILYARLAVSLSAQERNREGQRMSLEVIVAAIAHELNQPLTAVILNAKAAMRFLNQRSPDLTETRAALADIAGAGLRASKMIESTRTMLTGTTENTDSVDVDHLVHETLSLLRVELQMHSIAVFVEIPLDLPAVRGNKGQLMQVLVNLVVNAVESMAGIEVESRSLTITAFREGQSGVALVVADSGPGIDPTAAKRLFDPFYTTKPNGRGLGLAICRTIIEAHAGTISAAPGARGGTAFRIVIPAVPENAFNHAPAVSPIPRAAAWYNG